MPSTFTADDLAELPGPDWLAAYRAAAHDDFLGRSLPTPAEEVWRYFPIGDLDLDRYRPTGAGGTRARDGSAAGSARDGSAAGSADVLGDLGTALDGALVVRTVDGRLQTRPDVPSEAPAGVHLHTVSELGDGRSLLDQVLDGGDAFVSLNRAYAPDVLVLDVLAGTVLDAPVVVVHQISSSGPADGEPAPAAFPRLLVRAGRGSAVSVFEVLTGASGPGGALVVPVTELEVGEGANVSYVSAQLLGGAAWHLGRLSGRVDRDATLRVLTAGLGASRDRLRTDVVAAGPGSSTGSCSMFLGAGDQVHDVRTLQDHVAPRTTSDLLCQGVVGDRARSVYTGLIRVRHGASRADAVQRNRNLVLGGHAHADSVPNLDIEENDVRCSHASTVGPIDPDQRYYLESRGIEPAVAEHLIVSGFFRQALERCPVPVARRVLEAEVERRLTAIGAGAGAGALAAGAGAGAPAGAAADALAGAGTSDG